MRTKTVVRNLPGPTPRSTMMNKKYKILMLISVLLIFLSISVCSTTITNSLTMGRTYGTIIEKPLIPYLRDNKIYDKYKFRLGVASDFCTGWEIKDNKLFIKSFRSYVSNNKGANSKYKEVDLKWLFPGKSKVFAKWYTGKLQLSFGYVFYDCGGGLLLTPKLLVINVKNGIVTNIQKFNYPENIKYLRNNTFYKLPDDKHIEQARKKRVECLKLIKENKEKSTNKSIKLDAPTSLR